MSPYALIAIVAASILAAGWIWVSFRSPSRQRSVVEWVCALALYGLLLVWMTRHFHDFWDDGRWALMTVFGMMAFLFGTGFVVTFVLLVRELMGKSSAGTDATH